MKFDCPHCNQSIEADDSYNGSVVECPTCHLNLTVPDLVESASIPTAAPETSDRQNNVITKKKSTNGVKVLLVILIAGTIFFRIFCGVFVIQPIGALPDGATIVYFRFGLDIPFITSADGIQLDTVGEVSLLGRAGIIAGISDTLVERKIVSLPYIRTFYLWSTGGEEYER